MRVLKEDLEVLREPGNDEEGYENETSSYIVLHSDTWSYLHRLYGGGPTIGRYIYHNQAAPPFDRKKYCHQPLRPETFLLLQPRSLGFKVDLYPLLLRVNLHYRSQNLQKPEHRDIPMYISPNVTSLSNFYITLAKQCLLPIELLQMNVCETLKDSTSFDHLKKTINDSKEHQESDAVLDVGLSGRIWSRQKVIGPGNTEVMDWVVDEDSIFNDQTANSNIPLFNFI